jgi:hypothetical protein
LLKSNMSVIGFMEGLLIGSPNSVDTI